MDLSFKLTVPAHWQRHDEQSLAHMTGAQAVAEVATFDRHGPFLCCGNLDAPEWLPNGGSCNPFDGEMLQREPDAGGYWAWVTERMQYLNEVFLVRCHLNNIVLQMPRHQARDYAIGGKFSADCDVYAPGGSYTPLTIWEM